MGWMNGNSPIAINILTPVCTIATCLVTPVGIPSETIIPANQIVPVVPMFAPRTAAIAEGRGNAPDATKPMIAVVDSELDCHSSVQTIPPTNI